MDASSVNEQELQRMQEEIVRCRKCPRLVAWREQQALNPPRRYRGEDYWAKPVPGFGDPQARLLVIGLAPAAHGGNRTGRIFTGDRSGEWLFRALHKFGFASQPQSVHRNDGLTLKDCYVTAVARCAPPQNKLLREEIENCRPYLEREVAALWEHLRVVVVLGQVAFEWWLAHLRRRFPSLHLDSVAHTVAPIANRPKSMLPRFAHGATYRFAGSPLLICSYHPSQQNTLTRRLTEPMFDSIWKSVRDELDEQR
ncbi:MAG: uracil-DNA glycosylase [Candidatus Hydrogenedentota bacterium]|jgi:uracil-DNA glycosylase family 4|uniref:Type-5 uracil-DNA glycosylase n=1 Tax=Sumerlaea chitinivorans TaxID=2250252 RepID=A0A2Z4Y0Y9_SUMC1|nr:Uracil-DNA glycosylase, family 5 [Candidatus Sumerlaea chitinivorans]MCX7962917.1 uracil-DNA glycosylase [Candidatus Sumerlaea chitinivorans]RMH26388.1 MAG: uracil-DNA glycosylase [Candidatus Hydrogenedentota bacterium]GIX44809.1 MAG: uracil-DNA glycosylase [Candidatus Sumerlaea sp.]